MNICNGTASNLSGIAEDSRREARFALTLKRCFEVTDDLLSHVRKDAKPPRRTYSVR